MGADTSHEEVQPSAEAAVDKETKEQKARFYRKQLAQIVEEVVDRTGGRRVSVIGEEASVCDFNFKKLIFTYSWEEKFKITWEILEEKYVDPEGNKLFPLYYALNTQLKMQSMINFAFMNKSSHLILKMIEEHPQEMISYISKNKEWSMLHDLASIKTKFSSDDKKLAKWVIQNIGEFNKNSFKQTFLETAISNLSPNFDFLAKVAWINRNKILIVRALKRTSLRENLFRNVIKHCYEEKLISTYYYKIAKSNKHIYEKNGSKGPKKFHYTEFLLETHTQF
ncbi:unnamed protein product [Moneuplotes crassus]|uniref:Uncharacterized protein n=1 Tax=Euplotes crassus TaxID=5936 RepID=A0AAD2D1Z5_EUPCR|nr:unnamed protein product [Moneuplotes crassus]